MEHIFIIDGKTYDIPVISLKRKGAVLDSEKSGRVKTGEMVRSIIGTYYNYDLVFGKSTKSLDDYDDLYETLTAPVAYHIVTFPYGQETLTFQAYVSNTTDSLSKATDDTNKWSALTVSFVAKKPERTP